MSQKSLKGLRLRPLTILNDIMLPHTSRDDLERLVRIIDVNKIQRLVDERDLLKRKLNMANEKVERFAAVKAENEMLSGNMAVLELCLDKEGREVDAARQANKDLAAKMQQLQKMHLMEAANLSETIKKLSAENSQLNAGVIKMAEVISSMELANGVGLSNMDGAVGGHVWPGQTLNIQMAQVHGLAQETGKRIDDCEAWLAEEINSRYALHDDCYEL